MLTPPPARLATAFALGSLLVLTGCGNNNAPAPGGERTGPAHSEAQADPAQPPAPDADNRGNDDTTRQANTDPDGPGGNRPADDPPMRGGPEPNAGRVATIQGQSRLPFPEEGERLTTHLAFTRLSDHNAFEEPIDPEDIPDVVPWEEAGKYVGHTITVEGRIVDIGQTRDGSVNFLNFHQDWRGKFYMVVFDDLADTLEGGVEATFLNKLVRVRGLVEPHRGRPQIKIESMDQVEFVEE